MKTTRDLWWLIAVMLLGCVVIWQRIQMERSEASMLVLVQATLAETDAHESYRRYVDERLRNCQ